MVFRCITFCEPRSSHRKPGQSSLELALSLEVAGIGQPTRAEYTFLNLFTTDIGELLRVPSQSPSSREET